MQCAAGWGFKVEILPSIRQELTLYPGPADRNGAPVYTIYDPPANRFFQLTHLGFEILSRWEKNSMSKILDSVNRETTFFIEQAHVLDLIKFLRANHLVDSRTQIESQSLLTAHQRIKKHPLLWLVTHYLFFRIPLVQPDKWLSLTYPWISFVFTGWFAKLILSATLGGMILVLRQWDTFTGTFTQFGEWTQLFFFVLALSVSKVVHELGHAYAAHKNGCRVGSMGIAFIVLWPMLYTDTNEAWKLSSQKKRLEICAGGVLAELALAGTAALLWSFLPPGVGRSVVFFLATTSWIITLIMNISPFMRFDGYFILSDLIRIQNLHDRAFAMGRWWMREKMFGLGAAPPERFTPGMEGFLVLFAFGTWCYRFFLFLSIALMVYFLFFKALGLILMAIELSWFISLPIIREIKQWRTLPIRMNRSVIFTLLVFCCLGLLCVIPFKTQIQAPAVLFADPYQVVYTPSPGRVKKIAVNVGQKIRKGDLLMQMSSPDLEHSRAVCRRTLDVLEHQLADQPLSNTLLEQGAVLENKFEEAVSRLQSEENRQKKLTLTAPICGTIAEINPAVTQGAWLPEKKAIFYLVGGSKERIRAYVNEADLDGIKPGGQAVFYPDTLERSKVRCRIDQIDYAPTGHLEDKCLSSVYGGPIPASMDNHGNLIPKYAFYRILLTGPDTSTRQVLAGTMVIQGKPISLLQKVSHRILAVIIRESGF